MLGITVIDFNLDKNRYLYTYSGLWVPDFPIVILLAQVGSFKTLSPDGDLVFLSGSALTLMLALVGLTMGIIWLLPKVTQAVPASLAAIAVVTMISLGVNYTSAPQDGHNPVATVGDMLRTNTIAANSGHNQHAEAPAADASGAKESAETALDSKLQLASYVPDSSDETGSVAASKDAEAAEVGIS